MKVHVDNGQCVEGTRIGKGLFSVAYLVGDKVYLVNYKNDPSKECLALFCQGVSHHIPIISYEGYNQKGQQVFTMPFYNKLTAQHKKAWESHKLLHRLSRSFVMPTRETVWAETFRKKLRGLEVSETLKEAIECIIDNAFNYGEDCRLEFNRGNLGVDENGELILRDILCFESSIKRARNRGR